ncbi:MAG: ABC transporter substrate-binding protein [Magnetococcales bacterium]|nr:ABC transporter substrate-binding protein [Magnetococcales bacterium]
MAHFNFPRMPLWRVCLLLLALTAAVRGEAGERLILANAPAFMTGLVTIAQARGLLAASGLEVDLRTHPTGDEALLTVENGSAEVAAVAETAFTLHLFAHPELRALALIGGWDNDVRILARRDAGIQTPGDLRGKRIGTQGRLSTHFFLDQFLLKHGLTLQDITPVFAKAPQLADALVAGEVDAISMRDPFVSQAQARLGPKAVMFEEPGLYDKVFLLAAREETVRTRGAAIERLLEALIQAERFVAAAPDQARELLRQAQPEAWAELQRAWPGLRLRVWLDHRFILTLENVADWANRHHLVESPTTPNFLHNIDPGPLRRLRPIAVNLLD